MAAIVRQNFPAALLPFVGEWIGQDYKSQDTVYNKIFKVFDMDHAFHQDIQNYGAGPLRETGEQDPVQYDTMAQTWNYFYRALKFTNGFMISYEEMKDTKYMDITELKSKELRKGVDVTREILASTVLNNAFSSGTTYGDGVALISSAHPIGIGANQSNRPTTYVDISEAALEQASIDTKDIRNERGLRMDLKIKGLLIPKELEFETHRILKSTKRYDTANNDANAMNDKSTYGKEPIVWNYLSDPDAWFVLYECDHGLKYGVREKLKISSDNDFATDAALFKAVMRECVGASDTLRSIYGSQGA